MNVTIGELWRNILGRWGIEGVRLESGATLELVIDGKWVEGRIEFSKHSYKFLSLPNGVPLDIHPGMTAKVEWGGENYHPPTLH